MINEFIDKIHVISLHFLNPSDAAPFQLYFFSQHSAGRKTIQILSEFQFNAELIWERIINKHGENCPGLNTVKSNVTRPKTFHYLAGQHSCFSFSISNLLKTPCRQMVTLQPEVVCISVPPDWMGQVDWKNQKFQQPISTSCANLCTNH
jgi:hypothetical protein